MNYPTLTRQQLADLRGCTVQYISKRKLPKDDDGRYDLKDKEVRDFFLEPFKKKWETEHRRKQKDLPQGDGTLDDEKLKADILLKDKQARKLDLEFEKAKKDLIPSNLIGIYLGFFATGIRTYFLNIGQRIARGDVELRDRIEKEIKKAIEKTLETAKRGLIEESEELAKALEEKEDEG
jgi:hypothetical protein